MKSYRMFVALTVLVLASLACQALANKGVKDLPSIPSVDTEVPSSSDQPDAAPTQEQPQPVDSVGDSEFPMTSDAYQVINVGDGTLLYYTKMSLEDIMKFYQDTYTAKGYTENKLLTVVQDSVLSIVFEGDPSGKAVVIQRVDLGDGSRTVTIRLEDL